VVRLVVPGWPDTDVAVELVVPDVEVMLGKADGFPPLVEELDGLEPGTSPNISKILLLDGAAFRTCPGDNVTVQIKIIRLMVKL
jgi:hypothetical protein